MTIEVSPNLMTLWYWEAIEYCVYIESWLYWSVSDCQEFLWGGGLPMSGASLLCAEWCSYERCPYPLWPWELPHQGCWRLQGPPGGHLQVHLGCKGQLDILYWIFLLCPPKDLNKWDQDLLVLKITNSITHAFPHRLYYVYIIVVSCRLKDLNITAALFMY